MIRKLLYIFYTLLIVWINVIAIYFGNMIFDKGYELIAILSIVTVFTVSVVTPVIISLGDIDDK